jgi:hypothetical protein
MFRRTITVRHYDYDTKEITEVEVEIKDVVTALDPEGWAALLSDAVNGIGLTPRKAREAGQHLAADHPSLQASAVFALMHIVEGLVMADGHVDGRNADALAADERAVKAFEAATELRAMDARRERWATR